MGKKLYESNTIRSVATALRNKVKEYYTFTENGVVDDTGVTDNFDGLNTTAGTETKGTKVNDGGAKYPGMTTPSGKGFWYEYDYMLKELAPMPDDGRWPVPGDDFDKEAPRYNKTVSGFIKNDLGILHLNTRLGFPALTKMDIKSKFSASGAKYRVPDNGWIYVCIANSANAASKRLQIINLTSKMVVQGQTSAFGYYNPGNAAGTNQVTYQNQNPNNRCIYLTMPCARYDEVQIDYKSVSMSVNSSFVYTTSEANGNMSDLSIYFIPAKKTNYDSTYVDPKGDTTITSNNQFTLGKNKPFEVSLTGGSYTALADGWFYAINTELGADLGTTKRIELGCSQNSMKVTSCETNLIVDKGCIQQQASDPGKGPGKQEIVYVKSYSYCFMPVSKGATISVSGNPNKCYFLNAI